jgi:sialate O-acetylesterase
MKTNLNMNLLLVLVALSTSFLSVADPLLPSVFGDHMVLQRNAKVPVWGWADPGEKITVTLGRQSVSGHAASDGRWQATLKPMRAGGPFELVVRGDGTAVHIKDVLIGEVWICSGQSNMGWAVANSNDAQAEIAAANYPDVRLFTVKQTVADTPQTDCEAEWKACSSDTVAWFTAVGYFFGRELHRELGVPIGLIESDWGGTPAESWASAEALEEIESCAPLLERWVATITNHPSEKYKKYEKDFAAWEALDEEGRKSVRQPGAPLGPDSPHRPSSLYNAMISPLIPYAMKGVIWYQGESNAQRAYQYRDLFPEMIQDWRQQWGGRSFPFLFVQLANFKARTEQPQEKSAWAELREAQLMALSLKNTGMAVAIDIGSGENIHPKNKQDVGKRLALNALANTYRKRVAYSGPVFGSMKIKGDAIRLSFDHTSDGLVAEGGSLKGFSIAGADQKFVWADARIEGSKVFVRAAGVPNPVAVRYAWADNPECNLYNGAGLPATPFRTDSWQGVTVDRR